MKSLKPPHKIYFVNGGETAVHREDLTNGRDAKKAGHIFYEYISVETKHPAGSAKLGKTVPVTMEQIQYLLSLDYLKILP